MRGNLDDSGKIVVATLTWMLSLAAVPVLWWRRRRSVLDLWLMVTMAVWMFDTALSAVLNHGRFDLGWYAGRTYGLLAASFVLMVLLIENAMLYARLIQAHENERREHLRAEQKSKELAAANQDLEAFSYSVSHDLRAPLRSIDGFSQVLQEDYAAKLDREGIACTERIRRAAQRMAMLIDDLLNLSRIGRADLKRMNVDLTALGREIAETLMEHAPDRPAEFAIEEGMRTSGDSGMLRIALENLLSNSWKFTAGRTPARIEFGRRESEGEVICYVRDNGAGFDMAYAGKLFGAFQRLHDAKDFPGTGIGLAIVQRVMTKHGGRIWAEAESGKGATFYFTLSETARESQPGVAEAAGGNRPFAAKAA
jgi:signal transduction histidine kinase